MRTKFGPDQSHSVAENREQTENNVINTSALITRAVRHRVLEWTRFVLRIIFEGSTSGLMLIGWRAANSDL